MNIKPRRAFYSKIYDYGEIQFQISIFCSYSLELTLTQ